MAKTTFFQNAQNAGAVFPPAGCSTSLIYVSSFICSCIYVMYCCTLFMYFLLLCCLLDVCLPVFMYQFVAFIDVFIYLRIYIYVCIYVQLPKYRTWSVQKWGMPATALQSLIHHPGTCVAGPAAPQASCNLVKMGRRVSLKVFSEKSTLLVRAAAL